MFGYLLSVLPFVQLSIKFFDFVVHSHKIGSIIHLNYLGYVPSGANSSKCCQECFSSEIVTRSKCRALIVKQKNNNNNNNKKQ